MKGFGRKYATEMRRLSSAPERDLGDILYNICVKNDKNPGRTLTYGKAIRKIRLLEDVTTRLREHYQSELIKQGYMYREMRIN